MDVDFWLRKMVELGNDKLNTTMDELAKTQIVDMNFRAGKVCFNHLDEKLVTQNSRNNDSSI